MWGKVTYDRKGRLVASQNARQALHSDYSYTKYDGLGRIIEVGNKNVMTGALSDPDFLEDYAVSSFLYSGDDSQITQTQYDSVMYDNGIRGEIAPLQQNLRKRVAVSVYREAPMSPQISATYYSYDLEGNVKTLWQQLPGLGVKKLDYQYDLVSGKVNFLSTRMASRISSKQSVTLRQNSALPFWDYKVRDGNRAVTRAICEKWTLFY